MKPIIDFFAALLAAHGGLKVEGVAGGVAVPVKTSAVDLVTATVTIDAGEALSSAANLSALGTPVAIITDDAWDTQSMTFQGSVDGETYADLRSTGTEVTIAGVVAESMEPLDPLQFLACRYLKVRSGTAASAANQVDATTVTIVCRPM